VVGGGGGGVVSDSCVTISMNGLSPLHCCNVATISYAKVEPRMKLMYTDALVPDDWLFLYQLVL